MSTGLGGPPNNSAGLAQRGIVIPLATDDTPGLMSAADKAKLDASVADWPIGTVRYYAVDPAAGDDDNAGFSDVDMATAGTVALLTLARLREILPHNGDGRSVVIALGAGTFAETLDMRGIFGYRQRLIRSTLDFSNNAADKVICAAAQAQAGPGGAGEWTSAAGATARSLTVSAGALTAEPALIGKRVRFLATTTTAGLRNKCTNIQGNTGTVLTFGGPLPAVPVNGDTFVIEQPATFVDKVIDEGPDAPDTGEGQAGLTRCAISLVGVAVTATGGFEAPAFSVSRPLFSCSFCEVAGSGNFQGVMFRGMFRCTIEATYTDETLAGISVGTGLRTGQRVSIDTVSDLTLLQSGIMNSGSSSGCITINSVGRFRVGGGTYFANYVTLFACGWGPNQQTAASFRTSFFGSLSTESPTRIVAGTGATGLLNLTSGQLHFLRIQFTGGTNCIVIDAQASGIAIDGCTSSGTASTGVALDLTLARQCPVLMGTITANTFTGTGGDITLPGGALLTHAALLLTNVVDNQGNNIVGTAGSIVGPCQLVTNKAGAALAVGDQVRGNGTSGQVTSATGNSATIGDSSVLGAMVTSPADNAVGYMAGPGYAYCLFDGAPTSGAIAYLSPGTVRKLTTTIPAVAANNNKLRVGRVVSVPAGSTGIVRWCPENLAIVADGAA